MSRETDKRWKGIVLDWSKLSAMDNIDYELKPLNQQQVAVLLSVLQYQKWATRWTNLSISEHDLQVFIADIEDRLMRNSSGGSMTCEDIEDCLGDSPTITSIENNITTIQQTIIQQEEDCGCGGGMVNPEPPADWNGIGVSGSNAVCGSAFYITDKLIEFITNLKNQQTSGTLENWLVNFLFASGGASSVLAMVLWDWIAANPDANLITNLNASRAKIAEKFFCNLLDVNAAKEAIVADLTINANVRTAVKDAIECTLQSAFDNWAFIGSKVKNEDCSSMCTWTVVWDFAGTYVPDGSETAIYHGNTWTVSSGEFVSGVGYRGIADIWEISKTLPPDCRVLTMVHNANRNALCTAVDIKSWYRGTDGFQAEQYTNNARILSATPVNQLWTVLPAGTGAEMSQMKFRHDHFLCSPSSAYGSESHWVKMTGKGARPTV